LDEKTGKPLGLMAIVRKYQPDVIVNPRTGWYGDYKSEEGGQAITGPVRTEDVWEKNMTMAPGWGYTPSHNDPTKVISADGVKRMLADCVIRNMSLLLNVGPDRHGEIAKTEQDVLRQTGKWLKQVGDAVYGTRGGPWNPKDGEYGYAYKSNTIYIYLLNGFKGKDFVLPAVNKDQKVVRAYSVTDGNAISFRQKGGGETVLKGFKQTDKEVTILAVELNKAVMPK
jgi:alpha-L-fucosidase